MVTTVDPIVIVDYDESWPDAFVVAAAELRVALEPWIVEVEHVGSTAVPGLAVKPVIDIQVGVKTLRATPEIVAAIGALGYEYVSEFERELPNRRYFRRLSATGVRTHQIHLVERSDHGWWDRHILFRDWLRAHAIDRNRYAELKRALAVEYRNDRAGYTDAKSAFIAGIVEQASAASA